MELDEQTKRDTALNKFVERIVRMYMTRSGKIMGNFSSKTSADHPISIYHPEGEYLKGLVLYVE